jgi:DNA-binding XRE family transcriptional regulator
MHIFQDELAKHLGVDRASVQNWERNVYSPTNAIMPKIIAWLGYDPGTQSL